VNPGDVIKGKFCVERVIGTGGVGVVVAARHLALGETVALKFLMPGSTRDATDIARFVREAQSAVKLKNEHVARVIDVDALADGSPYIVMEYLEGRDVGESLRSDGPLSVQDAVGIILQVCEAVAEAHALGIVHRDLKPANFFVTTHRDGTPLVKVLDFGIAKARAELEEGSVSLTQTRTLLGSPVYMSPEQVRSARTVDHRTDIWSLGVSLFEMLTDTVPFGGDTVTSVAAAVATDPVPPLAELRRDVPPGLVTVIERCLEKKPDLRFESVAALAEALLPYGPEDSEAMLNRIRGILGLRRSSRSSITRDSNDTPLPQPLAQTLHGHNTTITPPHRRSRWSLWAGLAVVGALGSTSYLVTRSMTPQVGSTAVSPVTEEATPAAPAMAPGTQLPPAASVAAGSSLTPVDAGVTEPNVLKPGPGSTPATNQRRAAALAAGLQVGQKNAVGLRTPKKLESPPHEPSAKTEQRKGIIDDMVDTRR